MPLQSSCQKFGPFSFCQWRCADLVMDPPSKQSGRETYVMKETPGVGPSSSRGLVPTEVPQSPPAISSP